MQFSIVCHYNICKRLTDISRTFLGEMVPINRVIQVFMYEPFR